MPTRPTTADTTVALEHVEDRATRRPRGRRIQGLQALQDLARAPAVARVLRQNRRDDLRRRFIRRRQRGATVLRQARDTEREEPLTPLVAGVATDALARAQLRHGPQSARQILCKVMPLEHRVSLQPGRRRLSEGVSESVNHVPGQLSTMSLDCTEGRYNIALQQTSKLLCARFARSI